MPLVNPWQFTWPFRKEYMYGPSGIICSIPQTALELEGFLLGFYRICFAFQDLLPSAWVPKSGYLSPGI